MEEIDQLLKAEFDTLVSDIGSRMRSNDLVATGKTLRSLEVKANNGTGQLWGAKFIDAIETGRGPAKGGGNSNSNFLENLREWIFAKGLTFDNQEQLERFAKFLKWYINKFGSKQFRNGKRLDIFTSPIEEFKKRVPGQISEILYKRIKEAL